jgi:hypothetical protein
VLSLHFENNESVYYAVNKASPTIENVKELMNYANQTKKQTFNNIRNETKSAEDRMYAYHTVSYYDRVKGYFIIPRAFIEMSVLFRQNNHGKIMIQHEEYRYEWNWEKNENKYFFYGDGVMDFFSRKS